MKRRVLLVDTSIKGSVNVSVSSKGSVFIFFNCMFYQLLPVQHSCSSTQSWGSLLPYIVEMRDQNYRGCLLLFSNRNLGSGALGAEILYTHSLCGPLQE